MSSCQLATSARRHTRIAARFPSDKVAFDLTMANSVGGVRRGPRATLHHCAELAIAAWQSFTPDGSGADIPINPAWLTGTWRAPRDDGLRCVLALTSEGRFQLTFSNKQHIPIEFAGTYTVEFNVLALETTDSSLFAVVTRTGPQTFHFKLVGAHSDDRGLNFSR
jgi:hypothetical protein